MKSFHKECTTLASVGRMTQTQPADEPPVAWLATHKPLALLTKLSEPAVLFTAGAAAGALGKTLTAPLDRLKLIMQVRGKMVQGAPLAPHVSARHCITTRLALSAAVAIGVRRRGLHRQPPGRARLRAVPENCHGSSRARRRGVEPSTDAARPYIARNDV